VLTFAPLDGAVGVAAHLVSTLATAAAPLAGANAAAVGIIGLTVVVRLLLSPLSYLQARGERRRATLAPRLRELQHRYRDDRPRLHTETMALYRDTGVNPLGGCLPVLLQAPFFLVIYRLATSPPAGHELLTGSLFGVPLWHQLADGLAGAAGPVFAGLFVLLAVVAWQMSRRIRRAVAGNDPAAGVARVVPLLPYGTLLVAAFVPLAAGLYLLATTAWSVLERVVLHRG
jgi:YidC/Oxa1 family membrane protein insertase